ncbi:hypothetical protein N4R57_06275 [Rhodobacteraceae bacterium D3-12]|nr:hypothetical protein N4R57_06275 [Rhodobacteraceae bacterium D3-12]
MHPTRPILTAIFAATLAAPASAYTASNGLTVVPAPGGFEVVSGVGSGPRQFWCAAGDYARRVERSGTNRRIFIAGPLGPSKTAPGRTSVIFTTAPSAALANGPRLGDNGNYSVLLKAAGFSLTTGHAEGFCADNWEDLSERRPSNW